MKKTKLIKQALTLTWLSTAVTLLSLPITSYANCSSEASLCSEIKQESNCCDPITLPDDPSIKTPLRCTWNSNGCQAVGVATRDQRDTGPTADTMPTTSTHQRP